MATTAPAATTASAATTAPGSSSADATDITADCEKGGPGGLNADDLTAAAGMLGMSEEDLTTALDSGQTVAQVATDKGVTLQKVIDAIVASDTREIQANVDSGTITRDEADQRFANMSAHVTDN